MLILSHITKIRAGKKVLNDISLHVPTGSVAVLLGESGVGKSTLLRVLNNLETIDSGKITLDGAVLDLKTVNQTHTVGMVFQHFALFEHLTVLDNVMLPLLVIQKKSQDDAYAISRAILDAYGLSEFLLKYPYQLSGGQKQRVALARTLALSPKVVCLDEPTSALDPMLTAHVATIINDLAKNGYMVLVATHDITLVSRLNATLYLMISGVIVESASVQSFYAYQDQYPLLKKFINGTQNI